MSNPTQRAAPAAKAAVGGIRPYQQGRSALAGGASIKLSSNESATGPSPAAIDAFHSVGSALQRYPDGAQRELREAIADIYGLDAGRIVCGNGSSELLDLVMRCYLPPGDEIILSDYHFEMCPIFARSQGAELVFAPERGDRVDVQALLDCVTERTRLLTIANPNNPSGTYITGDELARLHAGLPENVVLLLDGAYTEYVTEADYDDGAALVEAANNVVMTRSFSKIYGLAALRVGWAYCPPAVLDAVQRIRTPFNANAAAMAAAAAAVRDTAHTERARAHNAEWLAILQRELTALGVEVIPSVANFYLLRFDKVAAGDAAQAAAFLEERGIIPRAVKQGSGNVLRITIGTGDENHAVLDAMAEFLA
ncbi:MAG: histidinol-phosphate transaminase [Gammaproteobacteria bacterium]|nr:histidinol-phosphate transaminase [Gammaproteobacteria bacterium]NNM01371.1 histidinol-phosphate transaminase [Gammaproteobacteria bacterium]